MSFDKSQSPARPFKPSTSCKVTKHIHTDHKLMVRVGVRVEVMFGVRIGVGVGIRVEIGVKVGVMFGVGVRVKVRVGVKNNNTGYVRLYSLRPGLGLGF